jgi:DNA-binding NarL/FixJ family response regulator
MPTVLVTDDDPDFRLLLESWLKASGYRLHVAASGSEALAIAKQHHLDVVITDLKMPGLSGLDLLSILKERNPEIEVIFLSGAADMEATIEALREGRAFDFLLKPLESLGQLNLAIEKALLRKQQPAARQAAGEAPLSARERQIIALVAEGCENREIADRLSISENTVKNHLARIYDKLKVANRVQAALTCERMGWL